MRLLKAVALASSVILVPAVAIILYTQTDSVKAPRMPMNGIWDIVDEGNEKYDALSLAIAHQSPGIGHRSAEEPLHGTGVVKLPDTEYWTNALGRPERAEDGTVIMKYGQFEYCMCRTVDYTVKPTGDPDVLVGEWVYKGKGDKVTRGKSVWQRRPPLKIDSVSYFIGSANPKQNFIRHKVRYGEGPLKIEEQFAGSTLWITILGERMAGGHNFWMDSEDGNLETRDRGWLCKNGDHRDFGDEWHRCGSEKTLGDGVVGIRFAIRAKELMEPGKRTIWLDGQPIPIEVVTETVEPLQKNEEVVTGEEADFRIEITSVDPPYIPLDEIAVGESFRVRLEYTTPPESVPGPVSVQSQLLKEQIEVIAEPTDQETVYMTAPVQVNHQGKSVEP